MLIGVTGSTGRLGGRVAQRLARAGATQRLLVRDLTRAPQLEADVALAPYDDLDAARRALTGIDVVLMVSAAEHPDRVRQHCTFLDAAAEAGVSQVVYTSFQGASPTATFTLARDHAITEAHASTHGFASTFLRNSLYADFLPSLVGPDGVLRGPAGDGQVAAVATDDVVDALVAVLLRPAEHAGATYELTGPQALTLTEVAEVLTRTGGHPVSFVDETITEAWASRASYGAPDWQVEAWVSTYLAMKAGELARVTGDVARLSGHPATSFEQLLLRV